MPGEPAARTSGPTGPSSMVGPTPVRRHLTQLPQGRKAARVSGLCRVHGGLSCPRSLVAAARPPWRSPPSLCRGPWLGFRSGLAARPLPPLPAGDLRRGDRAGARDRAAACGAGQQQGQPRLSVLRATRLRQDHQRPDPGPRPQLREGPDRGPVRRVRQLPRPGSQRSGVDRRDRDRRRLPRWCRRRARPAGEGVLRPGEEPLQGLHHRRGPHGHHAGLQRPAQAGRGATAPPAVHLRHHRAGEGHPDHPVADPPLPVPTDPAAPADRIPLRPVPARGRGDRAGRPPARGPRRRRLRARHPLRAGPAARRCGSGRGHPRARHRTPRLHPRHPARRRRRRLRRG